MVLPSRRVHTDRIYKALCNSSQSKLLLQHQRWPASCSRWCIASSYGHSLLAPAAAVSAYNTVHSSCTYAQLQQLACLPQYFTHTSILEVTNLC
jgi:hypothetical protein